MCACNLQANAAQHCSGNSLLQLWAAQAVSMDKLQPARQEARSLCEKHTGPCS